MKNLQAITSPIGAHSSEIHSLLAKTVRLVHALLIVITLCLILGCLFAIGAIIAGPFSKHPSGSVGSVAAAELADSPPIVPRMVEGTPAAAPEPFQPLKSMPESATPKHLGNISIEGSAVTDSPFGPISGSPLPIPAWQERDPQPIFRPTLDMQEQEIKALKAHIAKLEANYAKLEANDAAQSARIERNATQSSKQAADWKAESDRLRQNQERMEQAHETDRKQNTEQHTQLRDSIKANAEKTAEALAAGNTGKKLAEEAQEKATTLGENMKVAVDDLNEVYDAHKANEIRTHQELRDIKDALERGLNRKPPSRWKIF